MKKTLLYFAAVILVSTTIHAQTTFSTKKTINPSTGSNPYVIDSGELSGDTYKDIVIGTFGNTIEWYKNNGDGTFTLQTLVSSTFVGISSVHIADLNNDGFNDILAASYDNDKLVWFANDGLGNFGSEQIISNTIDGAGAIVTGTIDTGATIDVAIVAYLSGDSVWFSNDGSGNFTGPNTIASVPSSGPGDIDLADFDGDGDLDAVIGNTDSGTVELYDNRLIPDGTVSFVKYTNSVSTGSDYLYDTSFADVNDDGVLDIIKADIGGAGDVTWYSKNATGTATTFTGIPIITTIARPATGTVADFDDDTYNDVVITNAGTSGSDIVWFESTDTGTFNAEASIDNSQNIVYAITINDFDNDGDLDIATIDYQNADLNWFENLKYTLSTPQVVSNEISIYPNPVKNRLNFKGFTENINLSIHDVVGKKILGTTLNPNESLDVSNLQSGMYLIKFEGYNSNLRFVKN
jgi:hypothetical protein